MTSLRLPLTRLAWSQTTACTHGIGKRNRPLVELVLLPTTCPTGFASAMGTTSLVRSRSSGKPSNNSTRDNPRRAHERANPSGAGTKPAAQHGNITTGYEPGDHPPQRKPPLPHRDP